MKGMLKKQINEMTEDEIKEVLRRDYLRRLTRYRMTDDLYIKKYGMDFKGFQRENVVEKQDYTFEVESDAELTKYARNTLTKDKRFSIRISERDLNELQRKAVIEGLPYQTYISSIIHKFVNGRLIEAKN